MIESGSMLAPVRSTQRLDLYRTELRHLSFYKILYQNEAVMKCLGGPIEDQEIESQVRRRIERWNTERVGGVVATLKDTQTLVGVGGLGRTEFTGKDDLEVGYIIAPGHEGNGYGMEFCRALLEIGFESGVIRIVATPSPDNLASVNVLRKLGFSFVKEVRGNTPHLPNLKTQALWELAKTSFK